MMNVFLGYSRIGCLMRGLLFSALVVLADHAAGRSGFTVAKCVLLAFGVVGAAANLAVFVIPRAQRAR